MYGTNLSSNITILYPVIYLAKVSLKSFSAAIHVYSTPVAALATFGEYLTPIGKSMHSALADMFHNSA